jgi:hypothetical protein
MYPDAAHPRFFDVAGGEDYRDIDFLVAPGASFSVSGKVEGQGPMQYAVALALPELPALPVAHQWTEDDGRFHLEKIPPGTYDLYVGGPANGYGAFELTMLGKNPVFGRMRVQVVAENLDGVTVAVSAAKTVDVLLRGAADGCPKTSEVTFDLLDPWGMFGAHTVQANFEKPQTAHDLAPARYSLSAGGLGAGCYQVNRSVVDLNRDSAGPVTVQLGASGSIRGTLRGAANAKDFAVVLLDADAADSTAAQVAFADEQGRFEFVGLRPGRYRIAAQLAAGAAKARWVADVANMIEIDIPGGTPTDLELPVSKRGAQ